MTTTIELSPIHNLNRACTACPLREKCKGPVPGVGNTKARIAFIGEAPGKEEDGKGFPWQGRAGRYLNSLLSSIGLTREEVWLTNTCKCRPENNRTPTVTEANFCASRWLDLELGIIKPEIIMTLGVPATRYILKDDDVVMEHVHGLPFEREVFGYQALVIPAYHPASGLHRTELNGAIQEDFRAIKEVMEKGMEGYFKRVDEFPEPEYNQFEYPVSKVIALDTEIVGGKLWSVQLSGEAGTGIFLTEEEWTR